VRAVPSVLIVDRSEENREVLETALGRRGIRTLTAAKPARGLEMVARYRPDLIVLDIEVDHTGADDLCARFAPQDGGDVPMVLLGAVRTAAASPADEIVAKPYHYAPLIRKIEEILGAVE